MGRFLIVFFVIISGFVYSIEKLNSDNDFSLNVAKDSILLQDKSDLYFPEPATPKKKSWADSVFATLTIDEKIGQLFMVAAYSNKDKKHVDEIAKLITDQKIGGLIFMQGGPLRQANLNNYFQSISKVPLMITIDGEWGLAMRLDSTFKYPKQMTMGALQNNALIYEMGKRAALDCKRLGIHVNFAPVADINSNPSNPVIGYRSFGQSKISVTRKAIAYTRGMQDVGVMANAKHFPGHGDTDSDSHLGLPLLSHSFSRLDSLELYPFKELFAAGVKSVMVGHLNVPALDTTKNLASTLSKKVVTHLLKDSLKFKGLVFTDALNMKGVSSYYKPGELELKALQAGNDVMLFAEDVPKAIEVIKAAIDSNLISVAEIDEHCLKLLKAKEWCKVAQSTKVDLNNLTSDLNSIESEILNRKIYEESITVLINKKKIIPLKQLDTLRIASLSLGDGLPNVFQKTAEQYANVKHFNIAKYNDATLKDSVLKEIKKYNLVLVAVNNTNVRAEGNYKVTPEMFALIDSVKKYSKTIVCLFASPYAVKSYSEAINLDGLLVPYEENKYTMTNAAELIFGAISSKGKLPVSVFPYFPLGFGIETPAPIRMKSVLPQEINIKEDALKKIDNLIEEAIKEKAMPGCQVVAIKNGQLFLNKAYGTHTYDGKQKVLTTDLYDIASLTKVTASLLVYANLQQKGLVNPDAKLVDYLPELKGTNKENIVIREMMSHQAQLRAWIPFWNKTVINGALDTNIYKKKYTEGYFLQVADSMFIKTDYANEIYKSIIDSPLEKEKKYLYSDLGYYFLQKIIEKVSNKSLEQNVTELYKKIGITSGGYHPLYRVSKNEIVPTERDTVFRKQLVHGYVHDQGAAMVGGVGGHAGVFANALDVAKIMELYLNNGMFGGEQIIDAKIIQDYKCCQYCKEGNRRGFGFDKPEPNEKKESPVAKQCSLESFGHSGFTGTFTWVDPKNGLVYVFLSNRVHPDAENKKLVKMSVRTKVQEYLYEAVGN
ncbi:MAG: glycoside hydrolase family 3 N-terminal domain-containing protein [Bacteroidota bacterium]